MVKKISIFGAGSTRNCVYELNFNNLTHAIHIIGSKTILLHLFFLQYNVI